MKELFSFLRLVGGCLMAAFCVLWMWGMYGGWALATVVIYPVGGVLAVALIAWAWNRSQAWARRRD
jgi:hypothetical protein